MSHVSTTVRLRPVRFAYVVRPDDGKHALEIFRINTCLWGGKYNPIIPYFKQVPRWWDRHGFRVETAAQIINGYLDFFEPDFVVEAEQGLTDGLGFNRARVISLSEILLREGDRDRKGNGLSVFDLYRDLYRREFQFARRHEHDIIDVTPEQATFLGFSACLFGGFPIEPDLKYLGKAYIDAFEPRRVPLNHTSLSDLYHAGFTSALHLGHSGIEIDYHDRSDPALFVLDAREPRDLIDFWNLRIVKQNIVAIPVQWLPILSGFCRSFIVSNYRPLPGNSHGVMIRPSVMFARSIPTDEIERLHTNHLRVDVNGANVLQMWYPPIWRPSPGFTVRTSRPTLTAEAKTIDIPAPTTEGIVMFPRFRNIPERWEMLDGTTAINSWLQVKGVNAVLSDAGRATQQIVQTLGGFQGVASFARAGIVQLLNEMSRRPISRSAHHKEFRNRINDATKDDAWRRRTFENLVERKAVELGLELKCTKCSSWSWYSLKQLDYEMSCDLCLRRFGFPIVNPGSSKTSRWAYRLIGPFALPDYAKGGYAASLSLRFISSIIGGHGHSDVTWSAGQELELGPKNKAEADFILWYQRKGWFGPGLPH
jgi:hypothetical protein